MKTLLSYLLIIFLFTSCASKKTANQNVDSTQQIIELAQKNIYNLELLKTPQWQNFESYLNSSEMKALKGRAYARAFNVAAQKLPFSHFYIGYTGSKKTKDKLQEKPAFELEEINSTTVILHLRKFIANSKAMEVIVEELKSKTYKNLIIDLRNNSGGSLDAAVVLGRYLTNNPIDAGVYVTRKWYDNHSNAPTKKDIKGFTYLQDMSYKGFMEIQKEDAFRMVLPGHSSPIFSGHTYVLTSNNTASACEPFVHVLKSQNIATIVGEHTAGQMLSANWFKVNKEFSIFIPINDYITSEGHRLDQVGVAPLINVKSENALEETLKIIANKT